jgi:hypothetical protein
MKRQKSCGPRLGKLVHQLPGVVTFAYDLRFRRVIARWKGIVEEIHFGGSIMPSAIIEHLDLKKPSFRPSKWPRKLNHGVVLTVIEFFYPSATEPLLSLNSSIFHKAVE